MNLLVSAMLVVVAIIHLLPLAGVLGGERLASLYGLPFDEPNVAILMRHRAVLFGILGAFFLFAAIRPAVQSLAFVVAFISIMSFLWLAWTTGGYNDRVGRVVTADIVALVCLVIGVLAHIYRDGHAS
jgi:hypothetical protein